MSSIPTFIADESCDFRIVKSLREAGFDVKAIVEEMPGATDPMVLNAALNEKRILLTEDKDFGEWVFAHKSASSGVILIRYPANARLFMVETVLNLLEKQSNKLFAKFTVLEPGAARIRNISST